MVIELTPLHSCLGAEVRGVDLTRPVIPEVFAEIEVAFNRYGILVFPEQPVTDEQQLAFSRLFGPLEVNPNYAGAKMRLRPDIADISNLDAEGQVLARDDRRNLFNIGNQLWHTQTVRSSTSRQSARCSRPASSQDRAARPNSPICGRHRDADPAGTGTARTGSGEAGHSERVRDDVAGAAARRCRAVYSGLWTFVDPKLQRDVARLAPSEEFYFRRAGP
jgi:hypothetical protein